MSELSEAMWNIRYELARSAIASMPEHVYVSSKLQMHALLNNAVGPPLLWPVHVALRTELDL